MNGSFLVCKSLTMVRCFKIKCRVAIKDPPCYFGFMKKLNVFLTLIFFIGLMLSIVYSSLSHPSAWPVCLLAILALAVCIGWKKLRQVSPKEQRSVPIEILQDGVLVLDSKGRIFSMNATAESVFGTLPQRAYLFDHPLLKEHVALWQRLQQDGVSAVSKTVSNIQKTKQYDLVLHAVNGGSLIFCILKACIDTLQQQRIGKDFVANASHELRTPITIIKGFAETIHDIPELSTTMLEDFMEKIMRSCNRMERLVKNLLTLADLDHVSGARLQQCDLVALADNCIYTLLSLHPNLHIELLHSHTEALILADPDLLELAIMNVLENSVKYSEKDTSITVTVESLDEVITLTIADQGMGIPQEDIPHVFERFYTVNKSHSRKLGGAGLGLSIVKAIIDKHSGTIDMFSQLGKGTQCVCTFNRMKSV